MRGHHAPSHIVSRAIQCTVTQSVLIVTHTIASHMLSYRAMHWLGAHQWDGNPWVPSTGVMTAQVRRMHMASRSKHALAFVFAMLYVSMGGVKVANVYNWTRQGLTSILA